MARFSVYDFSAKEITQIISLVREWSGGRILPIDRRHFTKQVLSYGERWGLLSRHEDGKLYCDGRFTPAHDLPVEALWHFVEPMLNGQRSIGRSLTRNEAWLTLNIYPQGHRFATDQTLMEQVEVLDTLQNHGYLLVQRAGSIWEITRWHAAS